MHFGIITESPIWFIFFCFLTGAVFAFALYFRENRYDIPKKVKYLLATSRFFLISILVFLLLSPLLKTSTKEYDHPLVILAHDNSQSVVLTEDSSYYSDAYIVEVKQLYQDIEEDYETINYLFGDSVGQGSDIAFSDKTTDISSIFKDISNRLENRNVGAMLLFSDGIYNRGVDPSYIAKQLPFPVYTIALGDTTLRKDAWILKTNYNSFAYKDNFFPIESIINANKCKGDVLSVKLMHGNRTIGVQNISVNQDVFSSVVNFKVKAEHAGIQHYRLVVSAQEEEHNKANNVEDIYIEIIEDKQKILILYNAPHPDVSAMKSALESNINYEVEQVCITDFNNDIAKYNLVVLHQLPSDKYNIGNIVESADNARIPLFYVFGGQSNYHSFNALKQGLFLNPKSQDRNDAYAAFQQSFNLFKLSSHGSNIIEDLPPLSVFYGEYKKSVSVNSLFNQKIGNVKSSIPLIAINDDAAMPRAYILGEGIWRWKLSNYKKEHNFDAFNELINKLAQFLSIQEGRKRFNITAPDDAVEGEAIMLTAEVFNKNYEPLSDADVKIQIETEDNEKFQFQFTPSEDFYTLNLGSLKQGKYNYSATAKYGNEVLYDKGQFIVYDMNLESNNLRADHQLLYLIASQNDAQMYYPHNMSLVKDELKEIPNLKPTVYFKNDYKDLIDWPYLLAIIIALASLEWFVRKYKGSY